MAKNVFRPMEIQNVTSKAVIEPPKLEGEEVEDLVPEMEEYTGPTADELRQEAEAFKKDWEKEKAQMIARAEEEAERVVKEAEQTAYEEVNKKTNEAQKAKQQAEDEAQKTVDEAERKAKELVEDAERRVTSLEEEARKKGYADGKEQGFKDGEGEMKRLIDHLHMIINTAIEKRNDIIDESETQLINLVLLISKKVVKVISENQKNVVINNVIQALRKLKSRGDVIIRVNLNDVQLTSDHINDFMRMVENVKSVTVLEDSSVDKGGCIIETDFGEIDGRISSQLHEIEEKILEMTPIRVKEG